LTEGETDQNFNDESHVLSLEFDENLQQPCQSSCDREYEDNHSYVSSDYAFSESLFQEKVGQNQISEIASIETLDSKPSYDIEFQEMNASTYHICITESQWQENNVHEVVCLGSPENQDDTPVDIHEGSFVDIFAIDDVAASIKDFQEHTIIFPDVNDKPDEHIVFFHSEKDLVLDDIEQLAVVNEGNACLFVDLQDRVVYHAFEDSFAVLLESLRKVNFAEFINFEGGFRFHIEFPSFKLFFRFGENQSKGQSSSHLFDWLHWKYEIT
jgi:hypothetical protein